MQAALPAKKINFWLMTSLGFHSAAIIAFQLSLMQLISIVQWHHFAFMIISIAMLGFGASGTLLALTRKHLLKAEKWLVPQLMILSGLLMAVVFPISRAGLFRFDVFLLFSGGSGIFALLLSYLIFFLPFFAGALAIGIIFIKHSGQIGSYYFSNLLGSGIGGLIALALMSTLFPVKIPAIIGLLSIFSGLLLFGSSQNKAILASGFLAICMAIIMIIRPGPLHLSEYKSLEKTLNLPQAEVTHQKPSLYGLTQVVHSPAQRFAPALSFAFAGQIPGGSAIFVNGDYYGHILPFNRDQGDHILNYTTQMLPYVVSSPKKVLCVNAGSGTAISHALANQAIIVDAVIENRAISSLMKNQLADASGELFLQPEVKIHSMQARHFLATESSQKYDLIALPLLEGFGGTSGINALREEYGYTLEAFGLMLERLSDKGMIAVSSWMDYPSRTTLKIPATLVQAASSMGIDNPARHIAAVRSWGTITYLLKKEPFTEAELSRIRAWCGEMYFDPVLLPDLKESERQQYNLLENPEFFCRLDLIMAQNPAAITGYGFAIEPSTDNKPYFFQFMRFGSLPYLASVFGIDQLPFLELGYLTLLITLAQSAILALVLIILPLLALRKSPHGKTATLFYFGALGLGYMFAEIILIQRFVLYFGQPVYAIAAVISSMMLFSGLGSQFSQKLAANIKTIRTIGVMISIILLLFVFVLTPLIQTSIGWSSSVKILISLASIGIPAFIMGMMFPLGIRHLDQFDASQIPWAWGINGCLSVISTSLATLIAVESGFRVVLIIASVTYLLAAVAFSFRSPKFIKKSVS